MLTKASNIILDHVDKALNEVNGHEPYHAQRITHNHSEDEDKRATTPDTVRYGSALSNECVLLGVLLC